MLADQRSPFTHMIQALALMAGLELDPALLSLQPYAVEARYEEDPFPLTIERTVILEQIGALHSRLDQELAEG